MRYLYRETTEEENQRIEQAFVQDAQLFAQYQELERCVHDLNAATLQPRASTLQNILSYSRAMQEKVK
jgi:hypothetical protein